MNNILSSELFDEDDMKEKLDELLEATGLNNEYTYDIVKGVFTDIDDFEKEIPLSEIVDKIENTPVFAQKLDDLSDSMVMQDLWQSMKAEAISEKLETSIETNIDTENELTNEMTPENDLDEISVIFTPENEEEHDEIVDESVSETTKEERKEERKEEKNRDEKGKASEKKQPGKNVNNTKKEVKAEGKEELGDIAAREKDTLKQVLKEKLASANSTYRVDLSNEAFEKMLGFDLKNPNEPLDLGEKTIHTIKNCPDDEITILAALVSDIGMPNKQQQKDGISVYDRHSNETAKMLREDKSILAGYPKRDNVVWLANHHEDFAVLSETALTLDEKYPNAIPVTEEGVAAIILKNRIGNDAFKENEKVTEQLKSIGKTWLSDNEKMKIAIAMVKGSEEVQISGPNGTTKINLADIKNNIDFKNDPNEDYERLFDLAEATQKGNLGIAPSQYNQLAADQRSIHFNNLIKAHGLLDQATSIADKVCNEYQKDARTMSFEELDKETTEKCGMEESKEETNELVPSPDL